MSEAYVTQEAAQVLAKRGGSVDASIRVTGQAAQVVGHWVTPDHPLRVTQVGVQVLYRRRPFFPWAFADLTDDGVTEDMFLNEIFPHNISFNSVGATTFEADIITVDSGRSQRTKRWDQPLMMYDIAYGVRTKEQLDSLISFFRYVSGPVYGFLFDDVSDNISNVVTRVEGRGNDPASPYDQVLGTGDDVITQFQLIKRYPSPSGLGWATRPIYKPKANTVRVAIDGVELAPEAFSVNYDTGVITLEEPPLLFGSPRTATLNVSFVRIATNWPNNTVRVGGAPGLFSAPWFTVGNRITTTGAADIHNNWDVDHMGVIAVVAADKSYLDISVPNDYGLTDGPQNVTFTQSPSLSSGAIITAGFKFYVPVRFSNKSLPVTLEAYGVGTATDVKAVELRLEDTL
jgi:uncharacterized protein (TIGR02217 family)